MSNFAIIVDVMFATYLMNFIISLLTGLTTHKSASTKFWLDIAFGVILLILVASVN